MTTTKFAALTQPVSFHSLAFFRMAFGILMCVAVLRFFTHNWIHELYIAPVYHFTYLGWDWIKPWPGAGMYIHFAGLGILACFVAIGLFYRTSILLFALGFTYVELLDKTNYLNHYYLISLLALLMGCLPLHHHLSVDAWRFKKRGLSLAWSKSAPAWAVYLFRFQLALVYIFAGLAKLNADWLIRAEPLRTWLPVHTDLPLIGAWMDELWFAYAASWAGALFDLFVVAFLLSRRFKVWAYATVVIFHLATAALFNIGVFPWVMIALTPIFFAPDWPLQVVCGFQNQWRKTVGKPGDPKSTSPQVVSQPQTHSASSRWAWALGGGYCLLQLILPFRQYIYEGNSMWTAQSTRFSWRVMIAEKVGQVDYEVRNKRTGKRETVCTGKYLTPLQQKMLAMHPDMIQQFSHFLASQYEEPVEVYADAWLSINGRRARRFVDKSIDLSREKRDFGPKSWIVELDR